MLDLEACRSGIAAEGRSRAVAPGHAPRLPRRDPAKRRHTAWRTPQPRPSSDGKRPGCPPRPSRRPLIARAATRRPNGRPRAQGTLPTALLSRLVAAARSGARQEPVHAAGVRAALSITPAAGTAAVTGRGAGTGRRRIEGRNAEIALRDLEYAALQPWNGHVLRAPTEGQIRFMGTTRHRAEARPGGTGRGAFPRRFTAPASRARCARLGSGALMTMFSTPERRDREPGRGGPPRVRSHGRWARRSDQPAVDRPVDRGRPAGLDMPPRRTSVCQVRPAAGRGGACRRLSRKLSSPRTRMQGRLCLLTTTGAESSWLQM